MKHLVKFNEAISRDSNKRTLDRENFSYIHRFISSKGISWIYKNAKDSKDDGQSIAFLKKPKKSNDSISIQFRNVDVESFIVEFKKTFTNNIRTKGKNIIIDIIPESDNDFISDYEDDIDDSLVYFTDNNYNISKKLGFYSNDYFNSYSNSFKTAIEVNVIHISEDDDDEEYEEHDGWNIETLKRKEEFIIGKDLYKNTLSCVRRIQSFGLKVIVNFTRFEYITFFILCKEDEKFESTPLI